VVCGGLGRPPSGPGWDRRRRPVGARVVHARPQLSRDPLGRQKRKKKFTPPEVGSSPSGVVRPYVLCVTRPVSASLWFTPLVSSTTAVGAARLLAWAFGHPFSSLGLGVPSASRVGSGPSARSSPAAWGGVLVQRSARGSRVTARHELEPLGRGGKRLFGRAPGPGSWLSCAAIRWQAKSRPLPSGCTWRPNKRLQLTAAVGGVRRPWPAAVGSGVRPPPASGRC
jgi:hypothetical protein